MKARDFIYFAQGYFEIAEAGNQTTGFTQEQAKLLKDKIEKIEKPQNPDSVEQQCQDTVSFIDGVLSLLNKTPSVSPEMLGRISSVIQTKLNETFIHSVDPSYEGDQREFQDIHDGNRPRNDGIEFMC